MRFDIITIFPNAFDSYFKESIIRRAQDKKLVQIKIHNLRDFSKDKRRKVDDKPYGGGAGMVFKIEPLVRAVSSILKISNSKLLISKRFRRSKTKIILTSARGKQFTQKMARDWAREYNNLIIICGHYEGVDERVKKTLRAEEISAGPYVLTGGELPAILMVDAVSRHIPGVLGKKESLEEIKGSYPVYTRPEMFVWKGKKYRVPKVLLAGNHKKISEWRKKHKIVDRIEYKEILFL